MTGVTIVAKTANRKLGDCAATYVSQASCATGCPLRNAGCYAESGPAGFTTARLNRSTAEPIELARSEAAGIQALPGDRPLRVHVVGDCPNDESAAIVGSAMADYPNVAWTYTHAWRDVQRSSWGNAHVLASCESADDVRDARIRGYATAIVVSEHPSDRAYDLDGVKVIPCPAESGRTNCADCGLCSRELPATIGFAAHGARKATVKRTLEVKS